MLTTDQPRAFASSSALSSLPIGDLRSASHDHRLSSASLVAGRGGELLLEGRRLRQLDLGPMVGNRPVI
jgi:hypothetical protein